MSKRSRAERRKGQLDRAIRAGDLENIRVLVEKSPEKAAAALLQANATNGAAPDPEAFLELIVATSAKLRQIARFDLALELTAATAAATPRLRLERALAALGNHDDAVLTELIAADADLAKLLQPCLSVLANEPLPKLPPKSPSLSRAVHGCCRAATAVASKNPAQLRTALAAIAPLDNSSTLSTTWQNLYKALNGRLCQSAFLATQGLLSHEPFRSQQLLRAELGREVGLRFSDASRNRSRFFTKEKVGAEFVTAMHLAEMDSVTDPVARLRYFLDHCDLHQLPESERSNAALFQGYLLIPSAPHQALGAFDKAVALGADLAETLRGRWLATQSCRADGLIPEDQVVKIAEKSAERLIHILEREPDGTPLRTILLIQLGLLQAHALDNPALTRTLEALRNVAQGQDHEILHSAIQSFEVILLAKTNPTRALEQLIPLLDEADPKPDFWEMAVTLMRQVGRNDEADRTVLRAAKLSISPTLIKQAQKLYRTHRLASVPPAHVTAGLLAHELVARLDAMPHSTDLEAIERVLSAKDLLEAQRQLPKNAQSALDAAAVCILSARIRGEPLLRFSVARMRAATEQGRDPTWIAAAALHCLGQVDELMGLAHELSKIPLSSAVAEATVLMVALGGAPPVATAFLRVLSGLLDAEARPRVEKVIESRIPHANAKRMRVYLGEAARQLLPEFPLLELLDGSSEPDDDFDDDDFDDDDFDDDDFDDDDQDGFDDMPMVPGAALQSATSTEIRQFLWHIGLPQATISRLTEPQLKQLVDTLVQCTTKAPTPQSFQRLMQTFARLGFSPRDLENLDPTRRKPLRNKGFETCPF